MKSDKAGRISAQFVAPEDFGFMHDIVVQQGTRLLYPDCVQPRHDGEDRRPHLGADRHPDSRLRCRASAGASSKAAGCCFTTTSTPDSCRRLRQAVPRASMCRPPAMSARISWKSCTPISARPIAIRNSRRCRIARSSSSPSPSRRARRRCRRHPREQAQISGAFAAAAGRTRGDAALLRDRPAGHGRRLRL